jgi:hypothetical protein
MLTFLKHSATVSAIPMLTSILSSSFSSTEWRDVGPIDPIEQSQRSTTQISLNNVLGYIKTFVTLAKSNILAFAVLFDNLEHSRVFLVEYLNLDLLFRFPITVVGNVPSASLICSNFQYDLWAYNKMNVTRKDSLAYIWVLCTKVPISPTYIFKCMILEFTDSFCVVASLSIL